MRRRSHIQQIIRRLCGSVFAEPTNVRDVAGHRVGEAFTIRPHRHAGEIQFDLLDGCAGEASFGDRTVAVKGLTLLTHYPGERHGFRLSGGRRWHLKLACEPLSPRDRVWPEVAVGAPAPARLRRIAGELSSYSIRPSGRPPRLLALVADLVASWPLAEVEALDAGDVEDERDLADAVRLVRESPGPPPGVAAMARAAHLSERQLTRRFRTRFGCTPAEFADLHRLAEAKAMLLGNQAAAADVAKAVGFDSHSAFSRWFARHAGQSPSAFRADPQTA